MSVTGIEAALDRAVQQLSGDQRIQSDAKAAFLDLFERMLRDGGLANMTASAAKQASVQNAPAGIGTQPVLLNRASTDGLYGTSSLLDDPGVPVLEQLSGDLAAGDAQYNAREAVLRDRLNLPELERRLRASAESFGISYSADDLEGILRNAGYDAVHLGSSERYMAAVERLTAEAETRYRARAGNVPGSDA